MFAGSKRQRYQRVTVTLLKTTYLKASSSPFSHIRSSLNSIINYEPAALNYSSTINLCTFEPQAPQPLVGSE